MTDAKKPQQLRDEALDVAAGGAGATHELAHVVQQGQSAQFNPKELTIDKSVPWKPGGR